MFQSNFEVNWEKIITENYVGSCGVYHGFAYMPQCEEMGLTGEAREREFRRVDAMKLKVARTWFRPDYSREMMQRFNLWLEKMKELGVEVALQSAWWCTKDIWYFAHENYDNPDFTKSLANYKRCCDKLASWIAKALEYFIMVRGYTHIKYLVLFTEPTSYGAGNLPEGLDQFDAYEIVCRKIHEKLIQYNLRNKVKLMGPNGVFTSYDDKQLVKAVEKMDDIIDVYTLHTYSWCDSNWMKNPDFVNTGYNGWLRHAHFVMDIARKRNKPVWFDEYGESGEQIQAEAMRNSGWYGNFLAQANAAFMNGGLSGSLIWLLFDQKYFWDVTNNDSFYSGVHRWGTAYMPGDSVPEPENVRPSWYMISLLSRYMSGGSGKVCEVKFGEGICGAATIPEEGKSSILLVNMKDEEAKITVNAGRTGLYRYLYDPAEIKPLPDYLLIENDQKTENEAFTAVLPPHGVAVYSDYLS